jgi:hypothetical protein
VSETSDTVREFIVHHEGPDDIYYFDTWAEACIHAHELNAGVIEHNLRSKFPGFIRSWAIPYLTTEHEARWAKILPTSKPTIPCKWCGRPVESRSSFGEDYWRHVEDRTAQCIADGVWHEAEAASK